jgi:putative ABC transport system permease protein
VSVLETLRVAIRALVRNKLRSLLTALGVIIGVASVIAMTAIGAGARAQVESAFASMGSNVLIVTSGSSVSGGYRGGSGSLPTLTWDDLRAIDTQVPAVRHVAAQLRSGGTLQSDEANWSTTILGTSPDYFAIRGWSVSSGRLFGRSDVDGARKVVLLGQTVVDELFGATDPVGASVRIRGVPFEVVGVLSSKGQSTSGWDQDDQVIVPETSFRMRIQAGLDPFINGSLFASAESVEDIETATRQMTALLRDRHHIREGEADDFSIRDLRESASAQQEGTETLSTLLAAIAAVSLVVGGIGIMNIMLVSVTERTREIGLRMAVGARPRDLLLQFVVEALVLSLGGGLLGVGAGMLTAWRLALSFGWPTRIEPGIVGLAVLTSALVGLVFGLYPAWKASRLDPIVALRSE